MYVPQDSENSLFFFKLNNASVGEELACAVVVVSSTLCRLGLVYFQKILQNFSDSPSYQIFRRMHEVLNIDENKN